MYSHYISLKLSKHWEILQNNNINVISLSPLMFKIELKSCRVYSNIQVSLKRLTRGERSALISLLPSQLSARLTSNLFSRLEEASF